MSPKILSRKTIFDVDWMKIEKVKIQFENGEVVEWNVPTAVDAVFVVPIDNENNLYLTKEWRVAWEKEILNFPAGAVKGNNEKELLQQARNELMEEVGLDAKKIEKIASLLLGLRQKTTIHVYLARDLFESKKKPDKHEFIKVVKMPFKKAYDIFTTGKEISTGTNMAALLLVKEKLGL